MKRQKLMEEVAKVNEVKREFRCCVGVCSLVLPDL